MGKETPELMYELLKRMQGDLSQLKEGQAELRREFHSIRGTMVAMQSDVHNIYGILGRHDQRRERIKLPPGSA